MSNKVSEVVTTILEQLGGRKFQAMTGAHNMVAVDENTLSLKFKGSNKANYLQVRYVPATDLYTIEIGKVRGLKYDVVDITNNAYADMLQRVFTKVTGLYTTI